MRATHCQHSDGLHHDAGMMVLPYHNLGQMKYGDCGREECESHPELEICGENLVTMTAATTGLRTFATLV